MKAKKMRKLLICISVIIIAIMPFLIYAQSNNLHIHSYRIADYSNGTLKIECMECVKKYSIDFKSLVNVEYGEAEYNVSIDKNNDGIINAKDYAIINKEFSTTKAPIIEESTTEETTTTTTTKPTTEKVTDEEGWGGMIKP